LKDLCNQIGWLPHPGSQKLGAKWVEVRKRRARASEVECERILKTWPATPVGLSLKEPLELSELVAVASFNNKGAAGVGQPST